jgi:Amt family ammonium transporter
VQGESAFACVNTNGGLFYGGGIHQLQLQLWGAGFIIGLNVVATVAILYFIKLFVPLRMSDEMLEVGDHAVHGEEAYGLAEDDDPELVTA